MIRNLILILLLALSVGVAQAEAKRDSVFIYRDNKIEPVSDSVLTSILKSDGSDVKIVKLDSLMSRSDSSTLIYQYSDGNLIFSPDNVVYVPNSSFGLFDEIIYGKEAVELSREANERELGYRKWYSGDGHWAGISLMFCGLNLPSDAKWMRQSAGSLGFNFNFFDQVIYGRGNFGIFTGLGMEINTFRLTDPIAFSNDPVTGAVIPNYDRLNQPDVGWQRSELTTAYFQIPLLFEFRFGGHGSFFTDGWVNFGVVGAWCYESFFLEKSDKYGTQRRWRGSNVALFRYGYEMNLGIGALALKAKYYPESIFEDGLGPNVSQFNVGLALTF